jgi:hypothetical protein
MAQNMTARSQITKIYLAIEYEPEKISNFSTNNCIFVSNRESKIITNKSVCKIAKFAHLIGHEMRSRLLLSSSNLPFIFELRATKHNIFNYRSD